MKDALLPFDFGDVLLLLLENCPLEAKYCHKHEDRLKQNVTEREACIDELIEGYFHRGYPYQAIVDLLFNLNNFNGNYDIELGTQEI